MLLQGSCLKRGGLRWIGRFVKYLVKIAKCLKGWCEEYGGADALKSVSELCNGRNDLVLHCVGLVKYLCLKKAVPEMHVAQVAGVQNCQQR